MEQQMRRKPFTLDAASLTTCLSASSAMAQFIPSDESLSGMYPGKAYSPYAQRSFPDKVFWGNTHEKVYDVAWSIGREPDANGVLPPVGNTVDVANANWTNTIGPSELATVWTDPDFEPAHKAFYYARVLEIPTPRWVVYDAFRFGVKTPEGAETIGQERAYTSPIWYAPQGKH